MAEQKKNETGNTAAVAGFAGAIIGAGVAVAASRILADKETREKVMDVLTDVKKQVVQSMQSVKITAEDAKNAVEATIEDKPAVKKTLATAKSKTKKAKAE
jgi:gas vesicle protein